MTVILGKKRTNGFNSGWYRQADVNGTTYNLSIRPGKRVRLAYSNKIGYHWWGRVRLAEGGTKDLFDGEVDKGMAPRGLLKRAGVVPYSQRELDAKREDREWREDMNRRDAEYRLANGLPARSYS